MAETAIEWADKTWNPLLGCERVSPGCDGCYAINTATIRAGNPHPKVAAAFAGLTERRDGRLDWTGKVNLLPDRMDQPLHWKKPVKIFVNSQSDLFHEQVPDSFIAEVFAVMAATPRHTYQLLTKRHGRMRSLLNREVFRQQVMGAASDRRLRIPTHMDGGGLAQIDWPLPNVWLGVSVENQQWADIRIPALRDTPAAVRFLSAEPLLGPLADVDLTGIGWVICGGESGHGARPMAPYWAQLLRNQCVAADVPFFFKQWGEWIDSDQMSEDTWSWLDSAINLSQPHPEPHRVGKKRAGRLLDGRTWDEYPTTPALAVAS